PAAGHPGHAARRAPAAGAGPGRDRPLRRRRGRARAAGRGAARARRRLAPRGRWAKGAPELVVSPRNQRFLRRANRAPGGRRSRAALRDTADAGELVLCQGAVGPADTTAWTTVATTAAS